jgi:hypothetical protein
MPAAPGKRAGGRLTDEALAVSRQDPYGRACPRPGLGDLGDESVEDDLPARSAPGETAQCRRLQRSNFLMGAASRTGG